MCVFIDYPDEIKELMAIYEPFIIDHKLTNPTPEAQEAYDKVKEWFLFMGQQLKTTVF